MYWSIADPIVHCVKVASHLQDIPDSEIVDNTYKYLYQQPAVLEDVIWWLYYKIDAMKMTAAAGPPLGQEGQEVNHYRQRAIWRIGTPTLLWLCNCCQ